MYNLVISRTTRKVEYGRLSIKIYLNNIDLKTLNYVNNQYIYNRKISDSLKNYSIIKIIISEEMMNYLMSNPKSKIKYKTLKIYMLPNGKANIVIYQKVSKPNAYEILNMKEYKKVECEVIKDGIILKFDTYITKKKLISIFPSYLSSLKQKNDMDIFKVVYFNNKHALGKIVKKF